MTFLSTLVAADRWNRLEVDRLSRDIGYDIKRNMRNILYDDDINFTWDMSRGMYVEQVDKKTSVIVPAKYAAFVEYGIPPGHKVNLDALRNWVQHKLGITEAGELKDVTSRVWYKIFMQGIAPKYFMRRAILKLIGEKRVRPKRTTIMPSEISYLDALEAEMNARGPHKPSGKVSKFSAFSNK